MRNYLTDEEKIQEGRLTVMNLGDPEIQELAAHRGLGPQTVDEGDRLLVQAEMAYQQNSDAEKAQVNATDAANKKLDQVEGKFSEIRSLLSEAFREDDVAKRNLGLDVAQERKTAKVILQVKSLYDTLLSRSDLLKIAGDKVGITKQEIQESRQTLDELIQAEADQQKAIGENQHLTQMKNQAVEELRDFTRSVRNIARVALKNYPQLLEKLGVVVRSS